MPPLVKEFFPTVTVSEGKVEGKEEKNSSFFLSSALPFFLLEIFNTVKSKCNPRTTKRWIRTNISTRQKKRHRSTEQSLGLCGRGRGWDDLGEWQWNMYITICEIDRQSRFDAWDRALGAGALGWSWGMGWGGRWEGDSGWGTHVPPWWIHVNVWQKPLQYCKVISSN